ncbi:MAG: hypothetical protein IAE82_00630, partial [Opitutaceae bacterium]|nr:hypothetical protein [Opitutaceae bacterium]
YRAVKVVNKARFADERPFLRELDGITRFQRSVGDQPRQLALMHVGRLEPQGIFYYVMELADDVEAGTEIDPEKYQPLTLKALHERRPVLPAAEVIRIGSELARSLQGLHAAGLIHRDVKPSNIIFVAGVPKLADIGLVSSSDHTLTSLGTPGYSPPEGAGTLRADIYSLGKILYQLATGLNTDEFPRLPTGVQEREDVRALLELNEVFLKACQPNPQDRYASAQEMLDDLMLLHAGRSVRELQAVRARLHTLGRAVLWLGAAAAVVIAVLGVRDYVATRALAELERKARVAAEGEERLARYAGDLALAQFALAERDLGQARAALRRHLPGPNEADLRGPEWYALWHDADGDDVRTWGGPGVPTLAGLGVTRDAGTLVSVEQGDANELVVWDAATGLRRVLARGVRDLGGFSADQHRVLVGRLDRTIAWIDLASGAATAIPELGGRLGPLSRDGRRAVVGEIREGTVTETLWELEPSVRELARWSLDEVAPQATVTDLALDADGDLLAEATLWLEAQERRYDLRVVDPISRHVRFVRRDLGRVEALAFSEDGAWLAVGRSGEPVLVLDAETGATRHSFAGHVGVVRSVRFLPDGTGLVSVGEDQSVRFWPLTGAAGSPRVWRGHEAAVLGVIVLDRARVFTCGADGTIRQWSAEAPPRVARREGFWAAALGDFIPIDTGSHLLITTREGSIARLDANSFASVGASLPAFHPLSVINGRLRALDSGNRLVEIDLDRGGVRERGLAPGTSVRGTAIRVDPSGRRAALCFRDGSVEVWDLDAATRRPIEPVHPVTAWDALLSTERPEVVVGYKDGSLVRWDIATAKVLQRRGDDGVAVTSIAPAAAVGDVLIGRQDGRLSIVDAETLLVRREVRAHTRAIHDMLVDPESGRLFTGGADGFVIVWTYPGLRMLAVLQPDAGDDAGASFDRIYRLRLSPDRATLLAMTDRGVLRRWRLR